MRHLRFTLVLITISAAPPLQAQHVSLQIVVRDSGGLAIPYASAVVVSTGRTVGGDRRGHIPVSGLQVGLDTVMVRAIGFHPMLVPVRALPAGGLALTVTMARAPYILPEVTVESNTYDPIRAFHDRARGSGGRFVARWQIARTGYLRSSQIMQTVLGVRYEEYDPVTGGAVIQFPGCQDRIGGRVSVFIDGRELASSPVLVENVAWSMDMVSSREIEAMEVYRRRSEIPVRFRNPDSCAAVLLWTDQISQ